MSQKPQSVGAKSSGDVIEVYVPIFAEDGRNLLGVFETFKRADAIHRDVRDARLVVLAGAFGGGLLLYLSLFVIVRQAARKLDEQQHNLLKMQSELIASQRMAAVGEMAAAVAHGIGNPLSSIRAAAQVAMLETDTEMDALGRRQDAEKFAKHHAAGRSRSKAHAGPFELCQTHGASCHAG